jgi:hypothetical protein
LYAGKDTIMLPVFTIDDIRGFGPCYDPSRYLAEDWTGTALDVLDVKDCPAADRIWVAIGMMKENDRRLAACCFVRFTPIGGGRTVWDLLTDDRSKKAVEVAERFADGEATERELDAAWDEAWDAASAAAGAAAGAAADAAARDAADAAWAAARAAAWAAAGDVARLAAWDVADAAWAAARATAWATARDVARAAQIDMLREMLTA